MKKPIKLILPLIIVSSAAFIIFQPQNKQTTSSSNSSNPSPSTNQNKNQDQTTLTSDFHQLSILGNRCRGCGKCVYLDPSHFQMNGPIAMVISSTNLNSQNLQLAVNNCPSKAIILE